MPAALPVSGEQRLARSGHRGGAALSGGLRTGLGCADAGDSDRGWCRQLRGGLGLAPPMVPPSRRGDVDSRWRGNGGLAMTDETTGVAV